MLNKATSIGAGVVGCLHSDVMLRVAVRALTTREHQHVAIISSCLFTDAIEGILAHVEAIPAERGPMISLFSGVMFAIRKA